MCSNTMSIYMPDHCFYLFISIIIYLSLKNLHYPHVSHIFNRLAKQLLYRFQITESNRIVSPELTNIVHVSNRQPCIVIRTESLLKCIVTPLVGTHCTVYYIYTALSPPGHDNKQVKPFKPGRTWDQHDSINNRLIRCLTQKGWPAGPDLGIGTGGQCPPKCPDCPHQT